MLPAVRRNHSEADGEPHAGADADRFGREERLEDSRQHLGLDSLPGVANVGEDRALERSARHGQNAVLESFAHRVLGVDEKVDEHLHQLIGIGGDLGQRLIEVEPAPARRPSAARRRRDRGPKGSTLLSDIGA